MIDAQCNPSPKETVLHSGILLPQNAMGRVEGIACAFVCLPSFGFLCVVCVVSVALWSQKRFFLDDC